jgi:hypothetical protein
VHKLLIISILLFTSVLTEAQKGSKKELLCKKWRLVQVNSNKVISNYTVNSKPKKAYIFNLNGTYTNYRSAMDTLSRDGTLNTEEGRWLFSRDSTKLVKKITKYNGKSITDKSMTFLFNIINLTNDELILGFKGKEGEVSYTFKPY